MVENKKAYVLIIELDKQPKLQEGMVELGNSLNTHFTFKPLFKVNGFVFLQVEESGWNNYFESILKIMLSLCSVKKINLKNIEKNFQVTDWMKNFNLEFFLEGGIDFKQLIVKETETETGMTIGCIA